MAGIAFLLGFFEIYVTFAGLDVVKCVVKLGSELSLF